MEVANIYDNGPISLIARIKENMAIWTSGEWAPYRVEFAEGIPRSRQSMVDMVRVSGLLNIPANGTITQQPLPILQPAQNELLHLRFEPIDDVEGVLWEQTSMTRFNPKGFKARVDAFSAVQDPYLAATTFWIIGSLGNKDMNLEVRNPNAVALPQARFIFWGYRYILTSLPSVPANCVYLPAEGRQA